MQVGEVAGDHHALEVVPRPRSDSIARIHGRLTRAGLRAEVGAPRPIAHTDRGGEFLTVRIRAGQAAEIPTIADWLAGHEEGHRRAAWHTVLRANRRWWESRRRSEEHTSELQSQS